MARAAGSVRFIERAGFGRITASPIRIEEKPMPVSRRECRIKRVSNLSGPVQQLDLFGGETPRGHSGHTSVAGTVGGDTGDADRSDCAADVGACRREPARIAETDLVMISDKVRSHHLERKALLYAGNR